MSYRPEILVTAGSLEEVSRMVEAGADAVNIGEQKYGLRLPGDIPLEQIAQAVDIARGRQARIIVSVNQIMNNEALAELPDYLRRLEQFGVEAIVFGDPAVLVTAKKHAPGLKLHWSAEMTSTNYATANYWADKGASRAILARELNMEEVLEIKRNALVEIQVQVHGMTNIYHSKRELVKSYFEHRGKPADRAADKERGLYLVEMERRELAFPIYEDVNGTHIMSSDDICMIEGLHELMEGRIDSFKIEGLMKTTEYNELVVRVYREAVEAYLSDPGAYRLNPEWLEQIKRLQDPKRELTFGFYYKEQVY
ncbi:peptidase U32 family protein [Ferviditalea candida]|uniref:Peptidase U32 family protein n=1 Tax=Ferviditalea candida TaxID=3108399 RepID=A0ABU5ZHM3_9BACL|nr:peptidase U32 family protein [Paenibacillaceae bacterium T2]